MSFVASVLSLFIFISAHAATPSRVSDEQLNRLVDQYYAQRKAQPTTWMQWFSDRRPPNCDDGPTPGGPSCLDVACEKVGESNCDDVSEIDRISRACRGNYDGSCMREVCSHLDRLNCDDIPEIEKVAKMCASHYNGACVQTACNHLGTLGCDDFDEVERVTKLCVGIPASCLDSVCNRMGPLDCDDIPELERVAATCRGRP
jgi:hypothetical protein